MAGEKIYELYEDRNTQVIDVLRWLRSQGTRDREFVIHQLNYRKISVSFRNSALELAYIMKYDWRNKE